MRDRNRSSGWLAVASLFATLGFAPLQEAIAEPVLLVHYMPWYSAPPSGGVWGWHWTMNHFDPERFRWDGRREIASHEYPLIGPYDSGDDDVLECHVLLMKIAGIDGVVIDWYGTGVSNDYPLCHGNTQKLIPWLKKAGLRFAVCYEDQALKPLQSGEDTRQLQRDVRWVEDTLFSDSRYLRHDGRPLFFVFGPQHVRGAFPFASRPFTVGLPHLAKEHGLDGSFAWPPVAGGRSVSAEQWKKDLDGTYADAQTLAATAFPGFHDIYRQAGVHDSYGSIDARRGHTLVESLAQATQSGKPFVQVATWNDFGEGTMIEPTISRGYRSLEALGRSGDKAALRLPVLLHSLRKRGGDDARLDEAAGHLFASNHEAAERILESVNDEVGRRVIDGVRLTTDLLYREKADSSAEQMQRCRLDVYAPQSSKPFPVVVWFHGGGLTQGEKFVPRALKGHGVGVVAANYRLGPEVTAQASIEDAAAAIAWTFRHAAAFGGDPDRIVVAGHSAGAYLALLCGLDAKWLAAHGIDTARIAGLAPLSPQVITHFAIRAERGIDQNRPVIDEFAPLFHVRGDAPPILLVTGDRESELLGRYEECAYFWRMMRLAGHRSITLHELTGMNHDTMAEPAIPLLLTFIRDRAETAGTTESTAR